MTGSGVSVRHVSHAFGAQQVLHDICLDVGAGEYVVLLGPSGSGKTTLLSILGGFLEPDAGQVLIDGQDCTQVAPARRPTTTVFQDYALFPHMTVGANVAFGLRMAGMARAEREAEARAALTLVGLDGVFGRKPHQLSGGQRQRVALARALVMKPKLLLLDEPLGALDLALRRQMQHELKAIQQRVGAAFVHVTHDQEEAMALADLLVVMEAGRIVDCGSPERVYTRPSSRFSATFMGDNTLIEGEVTAVQGGRVVVATPLGSFELPHDGLRAGKIAVTLRPENLRIGPPSDGAIALGRGTIREAVFHGSHRKLVIAGAGGTHLVGKLAPDLSVSVGQEVELSAAPAHLGLLQDQR